MTLGVVLVPVLLAKLWSVIPKLFEWLPVRSAAHGLERLSLLMLVGGVIFEFVTGIINIQLFYVFPGSFYALHFYGAWVFIAAFVVHVSLRLGRMIRALRSRSLAAEMRTDLAHTRPEPPDPDGLVATAPAPPTMTRRGALAMVWGRIAAPPCGQQDRASAAGCAARPSSRRTTALRAAARTASRSTRRQPPSASPPRTSAPSGGWRSTAP